MFWVRTNMEQTDYERWWMMLNAPPRRRRVERSKPLTAKQAQAEGMGFMNFMKAVGGPQE